MCIAIQFQGKTYRPSRPIRVVTDVGLVDRVWAGCAREEILEWWKKRGAQLVDLHADKFAERSDQNGRWIWGDVPPGCVLRALIEPEKGKAGGEGLIKVVTRAASAEEVSRFEHDRIPVMEAALYPAIRPATGADMPVAAQMDLFGD